jgi:uncharacterized membrane protein (GlpM family)
MESSFWYQLGLSFLVGSVWVTLSTVAADRFGSKVGGLLGGMPSTVVISLLFIGTTQSAQISSETTTVMPLAQGINGLFILAYLALAKRGLMTGLFSALLVWLLAATALVVIGEPPFWISILLWGLLVSGCFLVVEKVMDIPSHGKVGMRYTPGQILFRALFGGGVISFAVLVSKVGGPLYGGIFAIFPAMFASTLVITYRTGGVAFSRAVAKSLMVSGMFNVTLYVIVVRYLYLWVGIFRGTLLAIAISTASGYITYLFMKRSVA